MFLQVDAIPFNLDETLIDSLKVASELLYV